MGTTIEQANGLTDLLARQPLAGFLALTLLAVVALFLLLLREKSAHQATLREVVTLTKAISDQWNRQLEIQQKLSEVLDHMMRRDRERSARRDAPKS